MVKLDLGCGRKPREGFEGVDRIAFPEVKHVVDLSAYPWPWVDGSVEEIHCSHYVEHLPARDRVKFVNELYRILTPGGKVTMIAPHWGSNRAYGDMTHCWPPVSEMWFYYLKREWRLDQGNAPHDDVAYNPDGYSCDFDATWGYTLHPALASRNQDFQAFAMGWHKEAVLDIIATLTKR